MAERYVREIRELRPEGPYHVGGSSLGGLVAYEMARQLAAANRPVGVVALFDTSVPGSVRSQNAWQTLKYRFGLHWHNMAALDPRDRIGYLARKARRAREPGRLSETIRSVQDAGNWAAASYVPGEYSGNVVLFRATKQPPWIEADRTLGWRNLVKGEIRIYDTPGHHADLVRDPRAKVLAEQLEDALREFRASTLL
jgi:thioesterase domain-containing protein